MIARVDFLHQLVVAELVGKRWHLDRFNADHGRYARLTAAGYRLLPFFDDVERHPQRLTRLLADALNLETAPPPRRDRDTSSSRPG